VKVSREILRQAGRELERRRAQADRELRQHRAQAYAAVPALERLDRQIADAGIAVLRALEMDRESAADYLLLLGQQNQAAQEQRRQLLTGHRFPPEYLTERHTCAQCRDTGFVGGRRCACFTQLVRSLQYRELSMDAPLEKSAFALFRLDYYPGQAAPGRQSPRKLMETALAFCRQYAAEFSEFSPSLLLSGPTGLGKTHLSLAIAGEVIQRGYGVIYGSAQNLFRRLERERFARAGEGSGAAEESLLDCDLLILDDLGAEFMTSFTASVLYNIINTRLNRRKPVIINTNLTDAELEATYSQRIASRIMGNYIVLRLQGSDIRQIKRSE
jgi:DNA replication protein DnaC